MTKMVYMSKTEKNKCARRGFFITSIYTLGNHKILTDFLVFTNLLPESRALVTRNNGTECNIFSQEIIVASGWNTQGILVHLSFLI